ncbi:MAG: hypothetical protein AAFU85_18345 [Planctomycetota bacterium]
MKRSLKGFQSDGHKWRLAELARPWPIFVFLFSLAAASLSNVTAIKVAAAEPFQIAKGKHIVLRADTGSQESLRELVQAFDTAVPQWADFWGLSPSVLRNWRVDACLMTDVDRFRESGDLPRDIEVPFGYALGNDVWVRKQSSDYYTRHLLLHEGVHALAINLFGGTGPSWYAEGIAELLSVHQEKGTRVLINRVPRTREEVPFWGRFKLMAGRRGVGGIPTIDRVLSYPLDLKSDVESYGWSWAAAMLLTEYPEYRSGFLDAAKNGEDRTIAFTKSLRDRLRTQWPIIQARWRLLTETLDYGFDWERERTELSMKDPLWDGTEIASTVTANQGWQSLGVRFAPGTRLVLRAGGRCTLADQPKPWISEPAGITIEYADGRPLGQLLLAKLPNATTETKQLQPLPVGAVEGNLEIEIKQHCWLVFRINDHLGRRGDNRGGYSITVNRSRAD